ncbi:MAG: Calx-beta domain-containing protein [Pirellulales bacterium]
MFASASDPNAVGRTIYGTCRDDVIDGGEGGDTIYGGSGNDTIDGAEGHDTIYGGKGNDIINGGEGNDGLYGGDGVDGFNPNGVEGNDPQPNDDGPSGPDLCTQPVVVIDGTVVDEDAGYAEFVVRLNVVYDQDVSVTWQTVDGTATTSGGDYTASGGTLVILAGYTTGTVSVPINNDSLDELDEGFEVQITSVTNAEIGGAGTCTIIDNDTPVGNQPSVTVDDITAYEGDIGALFTLTLSQAINKTVHVHFATSDGTAAAGPEYYSVSRDVYFAPNQTSVQVAVFLQNDNVFEPGGARYFFVTLSSPLNATIGDGDGYCVIYDDDPAPTMSINDVTVTEGDPGGTSVYATFTISLTNPADFAVTAEVLLGPGTALFGSDYSRNRSRPGVKNWSFRAGQYRSHQGHVEAPSHARAIGCLAA